MSYKQMVRNWDRDTLNKVLYHYCIQGTLDIYTSIVKGGDCDAGWTGDEFANCVVEAFGEFDLCDDDHLLIADLILEEYQEELTALNLLAESNQKPKSWAYLVRFE